MAIDLYEPRELNALLEERLTPRSFFRKFLFSNEETHTTEHIDVDKIRGARRVARFVNPKLAASNVQRTGYTTDSLTPPLIKEQMTLTAEDLKKRLPGENIYGAGDPNERQAYYVGKDSAELDEMIERREELMCRDVLFTGKINIKGEGVDYDIDYGLTNILTTSNVEASRWDKTTATIMKNIRAAKRQVAKACGANVSMMIVGEDVADVFDTNDKLLKLLDNRRTEAGMLKWEEDKVHGTTYIGNLAGVNIYAYDEYYRDPDTGDEELMVPAKQVLYVDPTVGMTMHYGTVVDLDIGSYAQARVGKSWTIKDPSSRIFLMQSRPLPDPRRIDSYLVDTVLD